MTTVIDGRRWPDASAYAMAARTVEDFFTVADLQHALLRTSPLGLPLPATGRNAAVFKATRGDDELAIRVFTRPPVDGHDRYGLIRSHLLTRERATFPAVRWRDDAVVVDGEQWPMVEMEWVEGETLDAWLAAHLGDKAALATFLENWRRLFIGLDRSEIAHGDLQHGNVLVEGDGVVRLVDLDGMYVPALADSPAEEFGHVHFQHPERVASRYWGRRMDGFSALVVEISVMALMERPELWDRYNDGGNNLIFLGDDFADHGRPLWAELAELEDPVLRHQVVKLKRATGIEPDRLVGPLEMLDPDHDDPGLLGTPTWLRAHMPDDAAAPADEHASDGIPLPVVVAVTAALVIGLAILIWVVA